MVFFFRGVKDFGKRGIGAMDSIPESSPAWSMEMGRSIDKSTEK
jgi:hypothetical protein